MHVIWCQRLNMTSSRGVAKVYRTVSAKIWMRKNRPKKLDAIISLRLRNGSRTKSKLRAWTHRQDDKDFNDLRFLIQSYPNDINSIADRLSEAGRKNYINEILERSQSEGFAAAAAEVLKVGKP